MIEGDWNPWSPRDEIAPRCTVAAASGRSGGDALSIACLDGAAFGGWQKTVSACAGQTYRFTAWYRARGVPHELRSVLARIGWTDESGSAPRPPDFVPVTGREGDWTRVEIVFAAPANARQAHIMLTLCWCEGGEVVWDDIALTPESPRGARIVRAVTIHHRPRNAGSPHENLAQFCGHIEDAARLRPDVICLTEGVTVAGTGLDYATVSEPIPGPTTERLGHLARRLHCYIAAGIYERVGHRVYNSAVLLGRHGKVVGTYRKTHLPREESEAGITPGDSYPVFQADFGTVGMMICWDVQFPEPARALARQGAELILLPIWGGSDILARARAIENHLFLVASSYDMRSFIVDPTGAVLAEATEAQPIALAELDLDQRYIQHWLGDMKTRTWKERRMDIPVG